MFVKPSDIEGMLGVVRKKTMSFAVGSDELGNIQTRPENPSLAVTFKETHGYIEVGSGLGRVQIEYRDAQNPADLERILIEELDARIAVNDPPQLSSDRSGQILVLRLPC
ncbi:MAG: hypothetical protein ACPG05_04075 [Bdellovibrionales bacterium]